MGRNFVLVLAFLLCTGCTAGTSQNLGDEIVLMPHHLLMKNQMQAMFDELSTQDWEHIVIVSPDHFHAGDAHISTPTETEHGFTVHRDLAMEAFPDATIEGYMLQNEATEEELTAFTEQLATRSNTLFIFSIDFSHYLPGGIAYMHDLRSMDVLKARDVSAARSLEVDCPVAVEVLLRLLLAKNEVLTDMVNTNPSKDIGVDTFENTTHVFARSTLLTSPAPSRELTVDMFFAHPEEWYKGLTQEDRYLYGYDSTHFDQGGTDHAVVTSSVSGAATEFSFDYFK